MARTEAELLKGLEHVSYELWMTAATTNEIRQLQQSTYVRSPALDNALLESMLMHTRSLIEFFMGNKPRPDDLHRGDFAGPWTPGPAAAVARVEADRVRLNKHLAHLTWPRFDDGSQTWNVWDLANAITQIADEWGKHLHSEGREDFYNLFNPVVEDAQKTLAKGYPAHPTQARTN
jgi:hypothetical protein